MPQQLKTSETAAQDLPHFDPERRKRIGGRSAACSTPKNVTWLKRALSWMRLQ